MIEHMEQYRFTRRSDGAYVVTTPAGGDAWRLLDGYVSTHAGGDVVCCALFGEDAKLTNEVQRAWVMWWQEQTVQTLHIAN